MTAPTPPAAPGAPADGGTTGQAPAGTQPSTTPTAPATGSGTQTQPVKTDLDTLPADVRKLIEDARAEAARHRTDKQTATQAAADAKAQRDAVLKALGLKEDGTEDVDPNKLTEQIDQYKAVAWENAVEAQVVRLSVPTKLDLNVDDLLDSNTFLDSLGVLVEDDPSSPDFGTKLEAHLKDFVGRNPKFKRAPTAPGKSGGTMPPGQPGTPNARPKSLSAAVKKSLGG